MLHSLRDISNHTALPIHHNVDPKSRKTKRRLFIAFLQLIICFTFVTSVLLSISSKITTNIPSAANANEELEIVHLTQPTNDDLNHPMVSRANNIIKNIMQGSNNAIVPRFKVYKRADDDDFTNLNNSTLSTGLPTLSSSSSSSSSTSSSSSSTPTLLNPSDLFPTAVPSDIPLIDDDSLLSLSSSSSSSSESVPDLSFSQFIPTSTPSTTTSSFPSFSQTTSNSSSISTPTTSSILPSSSSFSSSSSSSSLQPPPPSSSSSTFSSSSSSSIIPSTTTSSSSSSLPPSSSITPTLPSSTSSTSSFSSTQTPTTSQYSSDHGSFIVIGSTTIIGSTNTVTQFYTITASANSNNKSPGISEKNKNIAIGVGVGIGVPLIATIIILILLFYRRKQQNSVRNYVDSNGRDAGIAVNDGNFFKRAFRHAFIGFPTLQNKPSNEDFDDDLLDPDVDRTNSGKRIFKSTEDTDIFNSLNTDKESSGFIVNRPKPIRTTNSDPETSESASKPSTSLSPRVMNPDPIESESDTDTDSDAANYVPAEDNSSTPPPPPIPYLD